MPYLERNGNVKREAGSVRGEVPQGQLTWRVNRALPPLPRGQAAPSGAWSLGGPCAVAGGAIPPVHAHAWQNSRSSQERYGQGSREPQKRPDSFPRTALTRSDKHALPAAIRVKDGAPWVWGCVQAPLPLGHPHVMLVVGRVGVLSAGTHRVMLFRPSTCLNPAIHEQCMCMCPAPCN
jgi:hypothetical protein